jgi:threonine synthase
VNEGEKRLLTRNAKVEQQERDDENLTVERPTFVTHLECSATGERYPADEMHNLSRAGKPLLVRYDLAGVEKSLSKNALAQRPHDFWRYRELLPVRRVENIVSLGEAITPIVAMPKLAKKLTVGEILVKDEGRLPTGSFKARGLAMAVSMAKALGVTHMAMPTNGNAGAALAAYASRAGIRTTVFCPQDTPEVNVREIALQGATVYRVNGLIDDCGKIVMQGQAKVGWFDTSTLKEPYRIEGKKTMGLELAEQLGWELPDVVLYPTGGGTGLIGMWKAFAELEAIGFIGKKRPRMVAVQAAGCAPIVRAYDAGVEHATRWEDAQTIAAGIRVPQAIGDFLVLRAVRESGGFAIAVTDEAITAAIDEVARAEGLLLCPEGAATYAALQQSIADGRIRRDERVLLFNCATGLKYPMPPVGRTLDRLQPIDFATLR